MDTKRLTKWKPILDNIFQPYELENEILDVIAEYLENNLSPQYSSTAGGNGIGPVNIPNYYPPSSQMTHDQVIDVVRTFKERLTRY